MINEHLTRQMDIIPVEVLGERITVIGCGAIGSFTALSLAKMGFNNIQVFDFDKVETENMNCQFFRFSDIGKPKALALQSLVKDFTGVEIEAHNKEFMGDMSEQGIVISAVDSMNARKKIWEVHKRFGVATKLIIDPRMGAEMALCYAMNPMEGKDVEAYENTLYSEEDAVQERCTAKATVYTACMLSGFVSKTIKDYAVSGGKHYPRVTNWSIKDDQFKSWTNKGE